MRPWLRSRRPASSIYPRPPPNWCGSVWPAIPKESTKKEGKEEEKRGGVLAISAHTRATPITSLAPFNQPSVRSTQWHRNGRNNNPQLRLRYRRPHPHAEETIHASTSALTLLTRGRVQRVAGHCVRGACVGEPAVRRPRGQTQEGRIVAAASSVVLAHSRHPGSARQGLLGAKGAP